MENIIVVDREKQKLEQFSAITDLIVATTSKTINSKYTREDIENYINNPYKNDLKLRAVSDWFYTTNGIYKNIINAFANLPTLDNIILPSQRTLQKTSDKAYDIYYDKVKMYINSLDVKVTTRKILKSVAKYGGYVGYERTNGSEVYLQDLPLDFCRIKYKIGYDYQVEFNFKFFDKFWQAEDLELAWEVYPPEFKKLYNSYKSDKKSQKPEWQMIDIKKTFCVMADEDEPYFIPMYTGMFDNLLSNEEYKDIVQTGEKLAISKLLVQEVPLDKDGNLQMPSTTIREFHQELKAITPEGANAVTTPLKITDVSFQSQSKEKEDLLGKAERGVFVSSGYSGAIFADNGGNIGLNINIEAVTANIYAILEKIESLFTRKFKSIVNSKNYEFKFKYFKTTNLNIQENFDRAFKLLEIGGAIQPLFSLLGYDADTYTTLLTIENQLKIKDLLTLPQSIHTQSGNESGNPEKSEKELTDSGVRSRNEGTNDPNNKV